MAVHTVSTGCVSVAMVHIAYCCDRRIDVRVSNIVTGKAGLAGPGTPGSCTVCISCVTKPFGTKLFVISARRAGVAECTGSCGPITMDIFHHFGTGMTHCTNCIFAKINWVTGGRFESIILISILMGMTGNAIITELMVVSSILLMMARFGVI